MATPWDSATPWGGGLSGSRDLMDSKLEIKAYIQRLTYLHLNAKLVPMDSNLQR